MAAPVAVALVHYPVLDRARNIVATNITNFDIHDIARACEVYGVARYYLVHTMKDQQMFVARILDHWRVGEGSKFNPMRRTALADVFPVESLEEARRHWENYWEDHKLGGQGPPQSSGGGRVRVIGTSAREIEGPRLYRFSELKMELAQSETPHLLVFGTGFGMTEDLVRGFDGLLEPIRGAPPKDYRHLSVRSAVSICLDRLLGSW